MTDDEVEELARNSMSDFSVPAQMGVGRDAVYNTD